jgi:hypothetical protein
MIKIRPALTKNIVPAAYHKAGCLSAKKDLQKLFTQLSELA